MPTDPRTPPGYEFADNLAVTDETRAWLIAASRLGLGMTVKVAPGVWLMRNRHDYRVKPGGFTVYRRVR